MNVLQQPHLSKPDLIQQPTMNDVPALFYEAVCSSRLGKEEICAGGELAGLFGKVTADALDNAALHCVELVNGQFNDDGYFSFFEGLAGNWVDVKKVSRKHHWYTSVFVYADSDEYSTEPAALEALSAATKAKPIYVSLEAAMICSGVEEWMRSQFCHHVRAAAVVPKIPETLIQKKTLNGIDFLEESPITDEVNNQLLELLKQEQFSSAKIMGFTGLNVTKLVAEWREHDSEMAGKTVWCKVTPDRDLGFRECTAEERRSFDFYYPRFQRFFRKPLGLIWKLFSYFTGARTKALILKSEGRGAAIYCFTNFDDWKKFNTFFAFV